MRDKIVNKIILKIKESNKDLDNIKNGKGLTLADIYPTMHSSGIRKEN